MASSDEPAPARAERLAELVGLAQRELGDLVDEAALGDALTRLGPALEPCHPVDLALTVGAARGDARAISELERRHAATIGAACHRFAGRDHSVDDLRQILRAALLTAPAGQRPRIADYSGRGSLANWLRVTAVRLFIDQLRRKDRAREAIGVDELPEPAAPTDLALAALKAEHRAVVAAALREAALALSPGARHLLREHLVRGVSIDEVAAALGIHRATAARRIARARDDLSRETRRLVAARLAISERELDAVCGLVASGIDVSIRALLATPPVRG